MLYSYSINPNPTWHTPNETECYALWDTYGMLDNIRIHCSLVAKTALLLIKSLPACPISEVHELQNEGLFQNEQFQNDVIIPQYYVDKAKENYQKHRYCNNPTQSLLDKGMSTKNIIAAALLHDIAKTYTIKHGGDHAMLGAAFVRESTGNPYLAHAVYAHIAWHWLSYPPVSEATLKTQKFTNTGKKLPFQSQKKYHIEDNPITLPLLISYADKRVTHSNIVTLEERFTNLFERYGTSEKSRARIQENFNQAQRLERAFVEFGMDLTCTEQTVLAMDLKERI